MPPSEPVVGAVGSVGWFGPTTPVASAWSDCAPAMAACPPAGQDRADLQALKSNGFAVADAAGKQALAMGLVGCLGDPDPVLRDGIAYEALQHWMRAGDFDAPFLRRLREALYAALDADDASGVRRPFAALVLAEIARTDRVAPWMSPAEREAMLGRATTYLSAVQDYRGFEAGIGSAPGLMGHEIQTLVAPGLRAGVLSGPSFAQEVAAQLKG